jgi:hypothetical protein
MNRIERQCSFPVSPLFRRSLDITVFAFNQYQNPETARAGFELVFLQCAVAAFTAMAYNAKIIIGKLRLICQSLLSAWFGSY